MKSFYLGYVCQHMRNEFPHTLSYNRFVERQAQVGLHILLFLQTCALGKCTGISIIDSTPLVSCHIKRMHMHKTMKGWAAKGKYMDDRTPLKDKRFTHKLFGKFFADRGYISQELFEMLFVDDLHLVTKIKKNMKNSLMNLHDKLILRKRTIIETVNNELKNVCQIEHTRHRSFDNFATNLLAGLIAYNMLPKKSAMNIEIIDKSRLIA